MSSRFQCSPHRGDSRTAQRLIAGPQCVRQIRGPQHEHLRQVDSPRGSRGWIEMAFTCPRLFQPIQNNQRTPLATGFASSRKSERARPAAGNCRQIFDERPPPQAARGQEPVQSRYALTRGNGPIVFRPASAFQGSRPGGGDS